ARAGEPGRRLGALRAGDQALRRRAAAMKGERPRVPAPVRSPRRRPRRRRWLGPLLLVLGAAIGAYGKKAWQWSSELSSRSVVAPALAQLPRLVRPVDLEALGNAITEMDVARARRLAEE